MVSVTEISPSRGSEPTPIRRDLQDTILQYLEREDSVGAQLIGLGGSGKTVLMHMLTDDLNKRGRSAFYVPLSGVGKRGEVGSRILRVMHGRGRMGRYAGRTLQSSAGAPPVSEVVEILRDLGTEPTRSVLLLDGLDEAVDPEGTASTVEELSHSLDNWQIVVSSRSNTRDRRRYADFATFELGPLTHDESLRLLSAYAPEATDQRIADAITASDGSPLALALIAQLPLDQVLDRLLVPRPLSELQAVISRALESAITASPDTAKAQALLERLALLGGRESIASLAAWSGISEEAVARLFQSSGARILDPDTIGMHDAVMAHLISRRLRAQPFQLAELRLGAEDAERDDLLEETFVPRQNLASILDQHRSIVVGDRGAGKSAIFRKLSARQGEVQIFPVTNAGDLLQKITGTAQDADTLRAAWLVVVTAVLAGALPESAPKKLRQEGVKLRSAVGLPTCPVSRFRKASRAVAGPFRGTTLSFAVGPVNLDVQLPAGGRASGATVNVELFLQELQGLLNKTNRHVMVLFDRIDELFKYDRPRQEAVIQGLLQMEGHVSMLDGIALVVFLRTDLFELYDIQEKNKLISRRLLLEWSEEDWLQVLVRRVLANEQLDWVAERLRLPDGGIETRPALSALFPAEIEGRPLDRWLVDSVRNGNGDVSPRLAVLLLHLARDYSARQAESIDGLPLFTADVVARAMTEVSELSFSEVVTDFKVASSFVLNCRAGKRTTFTLAEVEKLFDPSEGTISEQVRLLERLGFLERIVVETDEGAQPRFRIPELYTRCWDHG